MAEKVKYMMEIVMKRIAVVLLSIMIILLTACQSGAETRVVPDFSGKTVEESKALAEKNGLLLAFVNDDYNEAYADGVMIGQSIPTGVVVADKTTVTLTVNNIIYKNLIFSYIDDKTTLANTVINGGSVIDPADPTYHRLKKGTLMLAGIIPEEDFTVLNIPKTYRGVPITAIDHYILGGSKLTHIAVPDSITVIGINMCGYRDGVDEQSQISTVVFLSEEPIYIGSFALNAAQLAGACKIYVPDSAVEKYKAFSEGGSPFSVYKDIILPISQLSAESAQLLGLESK